MTDMMTPSEIVGLVSRDCEDRMPIGRGSAAHVLRRRFGFRVTDRPTRMATALLHGSDPTRLRDLNPEHLLEVQTWWLSETLRRGRRDAGSGYDVDGGIVLAHWQALPEQAREVFPSHLDAAIRGLADVKTVPLGWDGGLALANALLREGNLVSALSQTNGVAANGE
jgi:hypothetical protein